MVQKESSVGPRRRGRPRAYDPQAALLRVTDTFWKTGYSGTSLDEISAATGMNRPSLYAAFGDKRALYLEALAHYWELSFASMREALAEELPLDEALMRVYDGALSIYFSGDDQPRGCFVIGTAVTEASEDLEVRSSLAAGVRTFDTDFEARFQRALEKGELKGDTDPAALAILATATMHTIAVRARAGVPRAQLRKLARKAVKMICR
jgi:TetR/AcrR family transcriptional regulator, copper-responsive repressor